jgi:hypothetical protein
MATNNTTTLLLISDLVLKSNWSEADLTEIFELLIDYLQSDSSLLVAGNLQPAFRYFLPSDYVSNTAVTQPMVSFFVLVPLVTFQQDKPIGTYTFLLF